MLLRNIRYTSTAGVNAYDGYYTVATGSGTSFTVTAPAGCPNGVTNNFDFEADIRPYFVTYIDKNTISVSATPGGSTVTLTNGGSGTRTVTQSIRSPNWGCGDQANGGVAANVYQLHILQR